MNAWIFQGNPDDFDLDAYLKPGADVLWTVRQKHLADRMHVGDRVYFWRSAGKKRGNAGVMASGTITEPPRLRPEDEVSVQLWKSDGGADLDLRVSVKVEAVSNSKQVVKREWLLRDPVASSLRILKMASETNYELGDAEGRRLEALWQRTGRDWTREEDIAALLVYERTKHGEVSVAPNSPIAATAVRIGRAVESTYAKVMNFRHLDPTVEGAGMPAVSKTDREVWSEFFDPARGELLVDELTYAFNALWPEGNHAAPNLAEPPAVAPEPAPKVFARRAGRQPDVAVRRAVEERAMALAYEHYVKQGFEAERTAETKPYDYRCVKNGLEVRVEVKGTTSNGERVTLTANEVVNAELSAWRTDLFLVTRIVVRPGKEGPEALGGNAIVIEAWSPAREHLRVTTYEYTVPHANGLLVTTIMADDVAATVA
ncbi:MAG: EVE domain-containing protein [Thermoanaerobaculia bacterium]